MTDALTTDNQPRQSITRRFNFALLVLYVLSIAISAPVIYIATERQVNAQADRELRLLVDMVRSVQGYVAQHMRPFLVERGMFYPGGLSGIVTTNLVAEQFKQLQPAYYIRTVSDNPLNPANRPQAFEQQLLNRFRSDRTMGETTEVGVIDGQRLLVSAAPKESKNGCLQCHGDPRTAPEAIKARYGDTSGYNYEDGALVGVSLVGVPLADVQAVAIERSLIAFGMLTILFAAIFLSINILVRRSLVRPILEISDAAKRISRGQLDSPVTTDREDEVGELAKSIELLRRSFVQAMKRLK